VTRRLLAVRLDSAGDVLLTGPALRAMRADGDELELLAGPLGAGVGRLLPGIDEVLMWRCPWIEADPPDVDSRDVEVLIDRLTSRRFDAALVFTSFHQSPLPTALLLRLAGIRWVGAISDDYPGSLLDLRHRVDEDVPESERALSLAEAAGFRLPAGDTRGLRITDDLPLGHPSVGAASYVVLHPGASAPAREWPPDRFAQTARMLTAAGWAVVVTGTESERPLCDAVAGDAGFNLAGRTDARELAGVLAGARAVVVANTGPAHLAAAVGTPVVSLFAPTVPAARWAPHGVPHVLLGDQHAACAGSRARICPVPGHPCLNSVTAADVVQAVERLTAAGRPPADRVHSSTGVEEVVR
jgi:ADP-heptose:LPS heptosyltransferase